MSATLSSTMPASLSATMCNNMSAKNKKIVIIICQPSCQPQCRPSCRPPCPPPCRPPCASLCQPPCRSLRCRRISILSASLNPHIVERRDIIAVADMVADTAADKKKLFLVDMLLHMVADKVPGIVADMVADKRNGSWLTWILLLFSFLCISDFVYFPPHLPWIGRKLSRGRILSIFRPIYRE